MPDLKAMAEQMRRLGMTEEEISYALKPLEPVEEALTKLLDTFDSTPLPLVFPVKKLERNK